MAEGQNPSCKYILRGDFNDCFKAAGGRGAKDAWCPSCTALRFERLERAVRTMASWIQQCGAGFGDHDVRGILAILDGKAPGTRDAG